jgi:hypothetical protein
VTILWLFLLSWHSYHMLFLLSWHSYRMLFFLSWHSHRMFNQNNTTSDTSGKGTWQPFGAPKFTLRFSGVRVSQSLDLCGVFWQLFFLFVPFILAIVLSVHRSTSSNYTFGIVKVFFTEYNNRVKTRGAMYSVDYNAYRRYQPNVWMAMNPALHCNIICYTDIGTVGENHQTRYTSLIRTPIINSLLYIEVKIWCFHIRS